MSVFPLIAYPLEVVKTNRIVQMQNASVTEELSRDMLKLAERTSLKEGLFRGALPIFPLALFERHRLRSAKRHNLSNADTVFGFSIFTVALHPLTVMQTKKQILTNEQSYS